MHIIYQFYVRRISGSVYYQNVSFLQSVAGHSNLENCKERLNVYLVEPRMNYSQKFKKTHQQRHI